MTQQAKKRSDGERTRKTILLVAERLFAEIGYDGVSIRKITSESNVELSAVNYHFKSKQNLFLAVMAMRVDSMNSKRLMMLESVKPNGDVEAYLKDLLKAFCQPFTEPGDELTYYRRLLALVINSKRWQTAVFHRHYDPIVGLLIEKINERLTFGDSADAYWYISFFLGALANAFAETDRVDRLSDGLCNSSNLELVSTKLIEFTVGGLMRNAQS